MRLVSKHVLGSGHVQYKDVCEWMKRGPVVSVSLHDHTPQPQWFRMAADIISAGKENAVKQNDL